MSNTDQHKMDRWAYVMLPCPCGGPRSSSKVCRNGINQPIESTDESDIWEGSEKALATLKERMACHVIGAHDLVWAEAMEHVNLMEPQYWTEEAPATREHVTRSIPVAPHVNQYVRMNCPMEDKINITCTDGVRQIVGETVDIAVSEIRTRLASHLTEVHAMTWEHACEWIQLEEVIVGVEPPMTQEGESASSDGRHRSRSPRGCKGGSGCASGGGASSGSTSGGKGGKDSTSGKAGKGSKGGITGKGKTSIIGMPVHRTH